MAQDTMRSVDEELGDADASRATKANERAPGPPAEAERSSTPPSRDPVNRVRTDGRTAIDASTAGEEYVDDSPQPSVDRSQLDARGVRREPDGDDF